MQPNVTVRLIMRRGPAPGQVFEFDGEVITVGRETGNDLVAADAEVSRHHARLVREGEGYLLEDLGSTNGTFLNGRRLISPQAIGDGDLINLGETVELAVEMAGMEAAATLVSGVAEEPEIAEAPAEAAPALMLETPEEVPLTPSPPRVRVARRTDRAAEPEPRRSYRNYFLAGCGCLAVMIALGAGAYWLLYLAPCEFYLTLGMVDNCLPVP